MLINERKQGNPKNAKTNLKRQFISWSGYPCPYKEIIDIPAGLHDVRARRLACFRLHLTMSHTLTEDYESYTGKQIYLVKSSQMEQRNSHRITRKVTLIKIYSADIQTLLIHRQKQAPPPAILQMVLLIIYDCYTRFIKFMRTSRILTCPFYNKTPT